MWTLLGLNLEQGSGSSIPISLKISVASGTPTLQGALGWEMVSGFRRTMPWVPNPLLRSPGQVTPHPRIQGGQCQPLQALSSRLSFPRLSGLSVYICTILSHREGQVCRSTWRIETKWAGRECVRGGPRSPSRRHRTSPGSLPVTA